jgi:hypothetical protein
VDSGPFPQSALDANKNGLLTDSQKHLLRALAQGASRSEQTAAFLSAAFGVIVYIAVRPSAPVLVREWLPIGCLALAAILLLHSLTGSDKLSRDLRHPRVESLEGPISRQIVNIDSVGTYGNHGGGENYYLTVAGRRFEVGRQSYQAAPDAGIVRIYFLSISRHVVNLEQLPDRSLPDGSTPQTLFHEFKQVLLSRDRAKFDELRAEMAGTENAFRSGISHGAVPPSVDRRDRRPLAAAIRGTWSDGPVTVRFSEDGTFRLTILGANERSGHWSVDGDGRLVADFGGHDQATDAWIVGDQLTVSLGEDAITLQRAGG